MILSRQINRILLPATLLLSVFSAQAVQQVSTLQMEMGNGTTYPITSVSFYTETALVQSNETFYPGEVEWGDVQVSRPLTTDVFWWTWRKQIEDGDLEAARQNFSISAFAEDGSLIAQWTFKDGWPSSIQTVLLSTDEVVGEQMTVVWSGAENHAPVITLPESFSAAVGSTVSFSVSAADIDWDPVVLSALLKPAGAVFQNGIFSWSVPLDSIETVETLSFQADDQQNEANSISTKQLTVTIPRDYDGDSLDDDWEVIWLGSLSASADDDSDGDRVPNINEWIAGTDPSDQDSRFDITEMVQSNQTLWVSYMARPDRTYQLECNTQGLTVSNGWTTVGEPWVETAASNTVRSFSVDAPEGNRVFYRICVQTQ